jgi:hypothetical protein
LFGFGTCALSVAPGGAGESLRAVTINNCTLYDVTNWLRWTCALSEAERVQFRDNLIVKTGSADFPRATSDNYAWFINNWSDYSGNSNNEGMLTRKVPSIPLLSTDVASPDFLKPDVARLQDQILPGADVPGAHSPAAP